ncbi:MAG TPA: hypothetical protein VJT83_06005 [Chitinophagaceae bacterium]|nr:hypothetical protein [Chitinophagaceae bacterium]
MKRRRFVYIAAVTTTGFSLNISSCNTRKSVLSRPEFLSSILKKEEITKIGKSYRSQFLQEATSDKLISELQNNNKAEVSAAEIEQMIKTDFEKGDTLIIEGWILSRTEARQSALYSLQ